jgi:hypothetical protein
VDVEQVDLIKVLQAGGTPALAIVGYLLWKVSQQITELKTSVDTLVNTMLRLVPGLKEKDR